MKPWWLEPAGCPFSFGENSQIRDPRGCFRGRAGDIRHLSLSGREGHLDPDRRLAGIRPVAGARPTAEPEVAAAVEGPA